MLLERVALSSAIEAYLVLNRMELIAADLVEVFVDILVWKIATDEDTVYQTICTSEFRKGAGSLSLSKIVE
jgi:hypothetical protein